MSTTPITKRFYPRLSEVITVDDLPDVLSFVQDGLEDVLDSIHYKNFQYSKSHRGDGAFYSLDVVTSNIGLDLPFGLRLVLNPDSGGDSSISSFPVTLQYQWEILAFLRSVDLQGFAFTPDAFYQLGLQVFKVTDEQVIANTLNFFVKPADASVSIYQQLVDDINGLYPSANLSIPAGQTASVNLIATLISQNANIPESISEVMFAGYILDSDLAAAEQKLQQFFNIIVPDGIQDYIQKLIAPKFKASLTLSAGIEFPTTILQPVDAHGVIIPNTKSIFQFIQATFYVDTEAGIGSQLELGGSLIPTYAQIGDTGLIISFTNAKLDLSRITNIPEADAAGYPVDFMGLYIQQASVSFNKFGQDDSTNVSASITANNLFIGTGGVSGTIKVQDNGLIYRKFGSFSAELDAFSITFRQNAIVSSSISGKLVLPAGFNNDGVPSTILIDVSIKDSGDFSITAKVQGEYPSFTFPNVFKLTIRSLTVGEQGGRFYMSVGGTLDFIANIPVLGDVLPKGVIINKLTIWDNGDLEFEGGGITVPKAFKLSVGPVKLEVSHLSIGSYSRKVNNIDRAYYYFGFDGMINTGSAGIDAAGNGIKYYFTHDDNGTDKLFDNFLSIDSIAIDIKVPGDASDEDADFILQGYLSMKNPDPKIVGSNAGSEYTGKVSVSIPPLDITGSAAMRMTPSVPSFVVDIGLELSTPIPLGGTGLGIYGFRGLIGEHYLPSFSATTPPLPENATWYEYYKAKSTITHQEGVEIDKFASEPGFSLGAGISIATAFDSGFTFSSKLFLMLGLPEVLLIQGQAGIIRSRLGLLDDVDPPFSAFIALSPQSFTGNLDVNFKIPDNGLILSVQASLDLAFYFNDIGAWHLYIGKDTPVSAQVQADILDIFKGTAYLMISSQGIKAGAGISYTFDLSFGPVGVGFGAALNMGGSISFKPVQIGAFINVIGYAYLKVFWFRLSLEIGLGLAVEAPNPFNITGSVHLKIKTPWPLPDVGFDLSIGWHKGGSVAPLLVPIPVLSLPDPTTGYMPAAATNILTNEIFPINYIMNENGGVIPPPGDPAWKYNFTDEDDVENVVIPLDSFIDIELLKPVIPGSVQLGGASNQLPVGYSELIPPQKGIGAQVKHQYEITALGIYAWNNNSGQSAWVPYNVYEAVTAIVDSNTGPDAIDLSQLKPGYWQFTDKDKYNKIRLLSQNMFSYMNGTTNTAVDLDSRAYLPNDIFCYETIQKNNIVNWKAETADTLYPQNDPVYLQQLVFTFDGIIGSVKEEASFGDLSLLLEGNQGEVMISLPVPVAHVELDFGDNLNNITVVFINTLYLPSVYGGSIAYNEILDSAILVPDQQNAVITYDNQDINFDKIQLLFNTPLVQDYEGDLVMGGHFQLPTQFMSAGLNGNLEMDKALLFSTWYNQSFTASEVLNMDYRGQTGVVAQWPMDSVLDDAGALSGILTGSPDLVSGFYEADTNQIQQLHQAYSFTANNDAMVIPYDPTLKLENGSFSFEITAVFNPFTAGISTLLYKINEDDISGLKKGFALHLLQNTPADPATIYSGAIPVFTVLFTCYSGQSSSGITITEAYTLDCATSKVIANQYKRIFISVNRATGKIELYIDKILKSSQDIPAELNVFEAVDVHTYLNQISYITGVQQARITDNQITPDGLINEVQILSDTINKTVQPVWRPDTIYAVQISTQDRVNGNVPAGSTKTHVFGFKTAGPLGHFHQESKVYQQLAQQDQAGAFKLANLQFYIDYDRSFPDAQGRYNLSKPVHYHNPQVKLYFTQPYINAMYANWDSYQGLPAIQSSLVVQLLDPSGTPVTQQLIWQPVQQTIIDDTNYQTLPLDQQMIFLFNRAAAFGTTCNPMPLPITKRLQQGAYQFPDLEPNKLYTALFNAVYQPDGSVADSIEVYKFSFMTSRYATFQDQASSYVLDDTPGEEQFAIYSKGVSLTQDYIDQTLKKLINEDPTDDPSTVLQYAIKYERLVYGGLQLPAPEPFEYSIIQLVINTNPSDNTDRKILGVLVYSPEPFNDPKLPATSLAGTIGLTLTLPDTTLSPDQFINSYSRDNSAVFITNAAMDIPLGKLQLNFRYKIFNGTDYETEYEDYNGPAIDITPYF